MNWTEKRIAQLAKLWKEGRTASEIAKEMGGGLTRNAVIGKAHRLKLERRPSPIVPFKPAKLKAVAPAPPTGEGRPLIDLEPNDCRWPISEAPNIKFCGAPCENKPYCNKHRLILTSKG